MHEFAICQSLIAEAGRVAAAHNASEVTGIVVAVGPLSGVEAPLLARAFEIARTGTIAERAVLDIEIVPISVWCGDCGAASAAGVNALLCGRCGTWQVDLNSGDELLLKRVELVPAAEAAAAVC
jgi:hydrogenase nickel incorporation protein HypA/HybF